MDDRMQGLSMPTCTAISRDNEKNKTVAFPDKISSDNAHKTKRPRIEETAPVDKKEPPEYDALAPALDVFDNPYFYRYNKRWKDCRRDRQETLCKLTVHEVYRKFSREGEEKSGIQSLANAIGALEDSMLSYYARAWSTVEDRLAQKEIIDLSSGKELRVFRERSPRNIPTADEIWHQTWTRRNSLNEQSRSLPLALVLGPSGSGKTFFALQYVSQKLFTTSATKSVTIYFKAEDCNIKFNENASNDAVHHLTAWIKLEVAKRAKVVIPDGELKMHVCLIIDEAGVAKVKHWFETREMLLALCAGAKMLATSVAVVVLGTGLTGNDVSSTDDAYLFRMKSWQSQDVVKILEKYEASLDLAEGETLDTVAKAIFDHPKLGALATNGRSAHFLVAAIAQHSLYYSRLSWSVQLDQWTKALVMEVVHQYIASNGISRLTKKEQRHVAASVFCALRDLKKGETKSPNWLEINSGEIPVAESLLQFNCELVDSKLKLLEGEDYAYTVTPAIAIVLYAMVGVPATLTARWKAEEELAALYAVQKWAIDCLGTYFSSNERNQDELNISLAKIRLLSLQKQVKSAKTKDEKILVPMVGAGTVLLNCEKAPFADVIASFMLVQAKQERSSSTLDADLYEEMEKCSLLKSSSRDTRVLQGLLEMWRGHLATNTKNFQKKDLKPMPSDRKPQASKAFPANLLSLVPQTDPIQYAVIDGDYIIMGETKRPLPSLDRTTITFMLATNVDTIKLRLSSTDGDTITINGENLDENLEISKVTLKPADKKKWARFVKNHVRRDIAIKFLLTKSVLLLST